MAIQIKWSELSDFRSKLKTAATKVAAKIVVESSILDHETYSSKRRQTALNILNSSEYQLPILLNLSDTEPEAFSVEMTSADLENWVETKFNLVAGIMADEEPA